MHVNTGVGRVLRTRTVVRGKRVGGGGTDGRDGKIQEQRGNPRSLVEEIQDLHYVLVICSYKVCTMVLRVLWM